MSKLEGQGETPWRRRFSAVDTLILAAYAAKLVALRGLINLAIINLKNL